MRANDYRADRAHAALLQRQAKLQELLAMKDESAPYRMNEGFVFWIRGPERVRIEQELQFIKDTLAMLQEDLAAQSAG
jgi:hypothetical protein